LLSGARGEREHCFPCSFKREAKGTELTFHHSIIGNLRTAKPLSWPQLWLVITCRPIELESWSNPLRIQQVFDLRSKKFFFGLDFGFFVCYVTMRACLGNFRPILPGPGPQANTKFFSLNIFLDSWLENESLEPLTDMLAYLDLKLCLKNQKMVKLLLPKTLI